MDSLQDIPIITFESGDDWREWLNKNYGNQIGVWIKIAKKDAGITSITYTEALDEALCYGWIDGMRRGFDAQYFLQKFTPRRKRSLWSKVNIAKVENLVATDRMHAAGHTEIERAKTDGRWAAAYDSQATATEPDDLAAALSRNPIAKSFYETLTRAEKYAVLWRLMTAKSQKTRNARLTAIVDSLNANKKVG